MECCTFLLLIDSEKLKPCDDKLWFYARIFKLLEIYKLQTHIKSICEISLNCFYYSSNKTYMGPLAQVWIYKMIRIFNNKISCEYGITCCYSSEGTVFAF